MEKPINMKLKKGFTLVETLVSLCIFATVLFLSGLYFQSLQSYKKRINQWDFCTWYSAMRQIEYYNYNEFFEECVEGPKGKAIHFYDPEERREVAYLYERGFLKRCGYEGKNQYRGYEPLIYHLQDLSWQKKDYELQFKGTLEGGQNYDYTIILCPQKEKS